MQRVYEKRGENVHIRATVQSLNLYSESYAVMTVKLQTIDNRKTNAKLMLTSDNGYYAEPYESIECDIYLMTESEMQNTASETCTYLAKRIAGEAELSDTAGFIYEKPKETSVRYRLYKATLYCRRIWNKYLDTDISSVVTAVFFGDKTGLSSDVKRDFRRSGISHILAVSGLHLSILLGMLDKLLRHLHIHKKLALTVSLVFLLVFMGMTGFSVSVMRAGIMWILYDLVFFIKGEKNPCTVLFFSVCIICMVNPQSVSDVGLLLSFSATLGILVLANPTIRSLQSRFPADNAWRKVLGALASCLFVSVAALIFTFPVTLFYFGEVSVVSPLTNILIQLPITLVLCLAPLILLFSFIKPIAVALSSVLSLSVNCILTVSDALSELPDCVIGLRYAYVPVLMGILTAVSVALLLRFRKTALLYLMFFACIGTLYIGNTAVSLQKSGTATLVYAVSGKNDVLYLLTGNRASVIDASDGSHACAYRTWTRIAEENYTELDTMILTHYHNKHAPMLYRLTREVVVRNLLLPEPETEEEKDICARLTEDGYLTVDRIRFYKRGEEALQFTECTVTVFPRDTLSRSVQPLLGIAFQGNTHSALYLSAAGFEKESGAYPRMRDFYLNSSDILLCGVHGPLVKTEISFQRESLCLFSAATDEILSFIQTNETDSDMKTVKMSETNAIRIRLSQKKKVKIYE